ncbi:ATP-binding protein [Maridesulfovibrio sp.]|uniref:ATP-binding protein n=1 Tax=Maridesulfovibrio sp. TaxID=2795000 RepID=UPI002A18DAF2|nr:ATP-binding protein [Maridesulfovibrio sp.]
MRSLYSILFRSYIVLALVPLVLLGIMLTVWIGSGQIDASLRQEQAMARYIAHDLRQHFSMLEDKLFSLNQYRNFTALTDQEIRDVAQEMIARKSFIYSIIILDDTGRIKTRVSPNIVYDGSEPLDPADLQLYKEIIKTGQVNYGPVHDDPNFRESLMLVGVPLKDRATGRLEIVLLAQFRLDVLWNNVVDQNYRDGENVFLIAEDGNVLAHPNPSVVLAKRSLSLNAGSRIRKNFDGKWVIGASADLKLGGLTYMVVAEREVEAALVPAIRSAGVALLATLLTAALVFVATVRNVRRITSPVKLLTEAALNIREDGFYPGITVSGFKEIKELSLAFDDMTRNLQRMLEELEHEVQIRKESEEALLRSEERFRALHNASFGGIAIHEQGIILDCNQGLAEISGFDVDTLVGMDIMELISESSRNLVQNNIRNEVEDSYEAKAKRKGGFEYPVRLESRNIPYKGRLVQVLEFRDMTSQKRAEEFIIQNEKMMSLGGLAAGMAHEINNPLAAIVGSCQNLRNRLLKENPMNIKIAEECGTSFDSMVSYAQARDCDKMVESIYESGKRAADIVKDMLSFSRQSEKSLVSNKVTDLMDRTIKLVSNDYDLKKNYDFKKIDIIKEYADSNGNVICYSNQIQQVFFNLLKNAAHAMADKEYVDDTPRLIIRNYIRDNMSVIEVEDNGPGVTEDARKKVFEPFFSTKGPGKGTGLGLSVSYFIVVKQHRGSMEVFSEPGEWTRFVIRIPVKGPESVCG